MSLLFVFFQAEDGIRDIGVTGVQTCALPIYPQRPTGRPAGAAEQLARLRRVVRVGLQAGRVPAAPLGGHGRSEERRVGKSVDLGGRRIIKKKKLVQACSSLAILYLSRASYVR